MIDQLLVLWELKILYNYTLKRVTLFSRNKFCKDLHHIFTKIIGLFFGLIICSLHILVQHPNGF